MCACCDNSGKCLKFRTSYDMVEILMRFVCAFCLLVRFIWASFVFNSHWYWPLKLKNSFGNKKLYQKIKQLRSLEIGIWIMREKLRPRGGSLRLLAQFFQTNEFEIQPAKFLFLFSYKCLFIFTIKFEIIVYKSVLFYYPTLPRKKSYNWLKK